MIPRLSLIVVIVATLSAAAGSTPQTPGSGAFAAVGAQPERGYFSQLPFERVDMVNGNLSLNFTDLVLPGNGGMNLALTRGYNHQKATHKWTFGFAGVPMRVLEPAQVPPDPWKPSLLMADGSDHPLHAGVVSGMLVTTEFWQYDANTRTLYLPNGWVATYSADVWARLIQVQDPFGNAIVPTWQEYATGFWRLDKVTQTVADASGSRTRTVEYEYDDGSRPWLITRMIYQDRTWTFQYQDSANRLTSVQPPVGPGWSFSYNLTADDGTVSITTPTGGTILYDFDQQDLSGNKSVLRSLTTGGRAIEGGTWSFTYGVSGPVSTSSAATPGGRRTEFTHQHRLGANGFEWTLENRKLFNGSTPVAELQRTYTTIPFGGVSLWAVDVQTLHQDGTTFTSDFNYSSSNFGDYRRANYLSESAGHHPATRITTRTFDYDFTSYIRTKVASTTVSIGGESMTTSSEYNNHTGFLESQTAFGLTTLFAPDSFGNVATVTDSHGHQTTSTFEWGVPKTVSTPAYTITRSINEDGSVASETRAGSTTSLTYDLLGRVTQVAPPGAYAIQTSYAADGSTTSRGSSWVSTVVDGFGRPIHTENAVGVKTSVSYDAEGFKTFASAPFSGASGTGNSFQYDTLGRLKFVHHADGSVVTYRYTETSIDIIDENNHVTTQVWQTFGSPGGGRLVGLFDAGGQYWTYHYDVAGNLTRVESPSGPDRTWSYTNNLLNAETQPESGTTTYSYTGGLLTGRSDARGQSFTYSYDANHRLTRIESPVSAETVMFEYDNSDNQTRMVTGGADTRFSYDNGNRLISREDRINGRSFTTTYFYEDGRDNLTKIVYPSGRLAQYVYDNANRITKVHAGGTTYAENLSYHPTGAMSAATFGNGRSESLTLNSRFRPEHLVSGPLDVTYGYDYAGNVTSIDDARPGFDSSFAYDNLDRLTSVNGFGGVSYSYDALGNRLTKGSGPWEVTYSYNGSTNRLSTATSALGVPETGNFSYDNAGNMTGDGTGTYSYSSRNMMKTATVAGTTTSYEYDAAGLRVVKSSPGNVRYYVRGLGPQVLAEYDATSGTPVLAREYIYLGPRLLASFTGSVPTPAVSTVVTEPLSGTSSGAGVPILLAASATASGGASIASVQFYANGLHIGSDGDAPFGLTWTPAVAGTYNVTSRAVASTGKVANSAPVTVTVQPIGRVISVTVSPGSVFAGQPATVSVTGNGYACGAVQIDYGDGTVITYSQGPPFELVHSWATGGMKTVTATGQGDCQGNASGAVSVTTQSGPSVSLTAPAASSVHPSRVPLTLTATASDPHGVARVDFYSGTTLLGSDTTAPWAITWASPPDGAHSLTAVAFDGYGIPATSAAVSITVTPVTRIVVTPASPTAGSQALITIEGTPDCAVNVNFGDGSTQTFISEAGLPITNPHTWATAGSKTLTAEGLGGVCMATATLDISVLSPPTVAITSPTGGTTYSAPASIPMVASASAAQGSISLVQFYANGAYVGADSSAPFESTLSNVATGSYTLNAVAYDTYGAVATSSGVTVIVGEPPPSTVLAVTVTPNPATAYSTATVTVTGTNPCTMLWMDFGDGDWWISPFDGGLPFVTTHTWSPGTYTVMARGFITCGGEVTTTVTVNAPPVPGALTVAAIGDVAAVLTATFTDGLLDRETGAETPSSPAVLLGTSAFEAAAPVTVTLDLAAGSTGTVASSPSGFNCLGSDTTCAAAFEEGTTVTLTATPNSGQMFLGWGGACSGTATTCQISATAGQLVTAAFGADSAATISYYHVDLLGSVRAITNAAGDESAPRLDYQPFGESTSSLQSDPKKFLGQDRDAETAFDQFGARYYRNVWGRFTSVDPIFAGAVSNPQKWNRYAYGLNSPLRYADASGLDPQEPRPIEADYGIDTGDFDAWIEFYFNASIDHDFSTWLALGRPSVAAEEQRRAQADKDAAERQRVENELLRHGLWPLIRMDTMEWTPAQGTEPGTFTGRFSDPRRAADILLGGPFAAGKPSGAKAKKLGADAIDFYSNGLRRPLHVSMSPSSGDFIIHVDGFNPRNGLLGAFLHGVLDWLPPRIGF